MWRRGHDEESNRPPPPHQSHPLPAPRSAGLHTDARAASPHGYACPVSAALILASHASAYEDGNTTEVTWERARSEQPPASSIALQRARSEHAAACNML
jgi:hypothetical protein